MTAVVYIHGQYGSPTESEHYKSLFPGCEVIGLDYKTFAPRETGKEIHTFVESLKSRYENIILIANSIGAFFSMYADLKGLIQKAYFISPIVSLEGFACDQPEWMNLQESNWTIPTAIIYGSSDNMTSHETISKFAKKHGADLTIMEGGEHWFHTEAQMQFLDDWIRRDGWI